MKMIVGLGNPGPRYETTRHNLGFLAIDRLVDRWKASGSIHKNEAEVSEVALGLEESLAGDKIILVKPQTFMNLSGKSVGPLFHFYKCRPVDLIVIHDDLDLDPLTIRIKTGGGTGGHHGLESLDEHLGKENTGYHRIRMGIGKPSAEGMSTESYVLSRLSDEELGRLDQVLDQVSEAVEMVVRGNVQGAMNRFNRKRDIP